MLPDVRRDPDYLEGNPDTVAELVVPIRFRDQVLGFLNLESPCSGTFSPSNQLAVQALADQAAGAIRLAMTMQRLRELPVTVVHGGHEPSFGRDRLVQICDDHLTRWGA